MQPVALKISFFLPVQYSLTADQLRLLTVLYSTRNCDLFFKDMHHFILNWELNCAWKKFKTWYAWVFCIFMTWSKLLVHAICLYNGLFWCFCINILYANEWASASFFYRRDHFKSWGGTLSVSTPPTTYYVQTILTLTVAVDTLGGYKWRHCGDFWIST